MKRTRVKHHEEIYRPLDTRLNFGYFTQCYKGSNIDHNYINEFYNSPFNINYGLVKPEKIYQLIKEELKNEEIKVPQSKNPTININTENILDKEVSKVSNLDKQVLELYFIQKQKPKVIARKLKISKNRIYRIVNKENINLID